MELRTILLSQLLRFWDDRCDLPHLLQREGFYNSFTLIGNLLKGILHHVVCLKSWDKICVHGRQFAKVMSFLQSYQKSRALIYLNFCLLYTISINLFNSPFHSTHTHKKNTFSLSFFFFYSFIHVHDRLRSY